MFEGRRGSLLIVSILVGLMSAAACSLPEGDQSTPTQLHYKWIQVRSTGDADAMWELIHPDVKGEFERWHIAERIMVHEIKAAYPEEDAAKALQAIGGAERGELDTPRALFKRFLRPSPEAPGFLGEIAAHVKSEEIAGDGKTATIRTFGGDEVTFQKGPDDLWYATLAPAESVRLKNARVRAEQNLARVKANLQKLGRNSP